MLLLQKPGYLFSRYELASTLLTFGTRLTVLDLNLPANWDPAPKPVAGFPKPAFPVRPKDYKTGKPTCAHLSKIADYTYVLDVVLGYLPNLKNLSFVGPYASTSVFSAFPPSLTQCVLGFALPLLRSSDSTTLSAASPLAAARRSSRSRLPRSSTRT